MEYANIYIEKKIMKNPIDTYVVKKRDLEKILGHKVVSIHPMLSDRARDWSDVPILMKPWKAWQLRYDVEYMILTAATDTMFHFILNNRIRHGIDSQYQE